MCESEGPSVDKETMLQRLGGILGMLVATTVWGVLCIVIWALWLCAVSVSAIALTLVLCTECAGKCVQWISGWIWRPPVLDGLEKVTWVWLTALQTFFQMQVIIQRGVAILDMTPYDAVQWLVEVFSP